MSLPEQPDPPPLASPVERIVAARYVLLLAAAALVACSALWNVPAAFTAAAILLLVLVAGFVPRHRATLLGRGGGAVRTGPWPDASMKAAVEAFPRAGFILDAEGTVRYANLRAGHLFPATRPGDPFALTFRSPEIGAALNAAWRGGAQPVEYSEPGHAKRVYSIASDLIRLPGDNASFLLVTFDDVSDRQAIARMRADFVANASHELRTPLASLTGFIETLRGPARNDPQASEKFLEIMLDQARRMRRLIDDLLSLSRAEMRLHRRPTKRVDLAAILHHVRDALGPLAREHSVALAFEVPAAPVEVIGDRDELIQVFQNLVENAVRYGACGGRVDVSLEEMTGDNPMIAVHVEDHGPGIPPEHVPRLTERFYRVDVGASREMKGTGLGLAIVKHILTRHQGRLDVKSVLGEGSRFTVELPYPQGASGEHQETT
jgi:two-component system phosphate regulon sensor histidine kinase PhoR